MLILLPFLDPPIRVLEVRKVSQVTGETDRQRHVLADNQTETRFGLWGTDLGASFEHEGKLVFLFGDTIAAGPFTADRPRDGDAIAFSSDRNPDDGLTLDFVRAADGKYRAVQIPGVSLKAFEVPSGGFSAGGHLYAIYTTSSVGSPQGEIMGRSVLARSDDGKSWTKVADFSSEKFINVSAAVVDASQTPGLPIRRGRGVCFWASGREYRRSSPCLAFVPIDQVEDPRAYRYWNGGSWAEKEVEAKPIFVHDQIGELSVAWCAPLKRWLMTYNSGSPRGILIRTADRPVGPWSEPVVLFDAKDGYGKFMHAANGPDGMSDPNREKEWGGEYAPYLTPRFFRKTREGVAIYFLMSTWNPYQVVLMRAVVE